MVRYMVILVCVCSLCAAGLAQPYYFRNYQVEQGLSHNTVFSCVQDGRGFVWLGTKDGLNRFDGYTFKVFRKDADDPGSLGDNFIRSLHVSNADTLYIGTRNGVYRYDARQQNFKCLFATREEVRDIKTDKAGNTWFIAGTTLFRINEQLNTKSQYSPESYFQSTSVCVDSTGSVWVATSQGQLQLYKGNNQFTAFDLFTNKDRALASPWIEKIIAADSQILVGTANYGVKSFNIYEYSCKDLLTYNDDGTGIFARDFARVSASEVWIATESGIFVYDTKQKEFVNLRKQYGNPFAISDNAVYSLLRDREGGIWAGTYFGGINYYPRQYVQFSKLTPGYDKYSLGGNAVREICEDKQGDLWIGTEDGGLNRLNKKTRVITTYTPTGNNEGISYPNIHGLLVRGDELWIGTFEHGLDIMDIKSGKIKRRYPGGSNSSALRSNFIVVIYQTRNGIVYIGTRRGLYRYDDSGQSFETVPDIPAGSFVHSILEDHTGGLWIGTLANGLYHLAKDGIRTVFQHIPGDKESLPSDAVTTIFESADGEIWIGTEGGGLCRFNSKGKRFQHFTTKQGLPSNTIFKILEDHTRRLWVSTSNGLMSFEPATNLINVYTTANGLLSNQFNYNSGYKSADGTLYFGSAKGLVSFNPAAFTPNNFLPPVFITGLSVNDQELMPDKEHGPLKQAISFTRSVTLAHDQGSFSIEFAALSFTAPEMTQYKYIMEGLDNDWTYLKTNRRVYFTDLSPGNYTFRVTATNVPGHWAAGTAILNIRIMQPLWATPMAFVFYALLVTGAAILLFRSYHQRVKEKTARKIEHIEHEKEKEIYESKINFFTNVAHEIKTPLTLIRAPMEQIAKKAGKNSGLDYELEVMQKNTDRLLELTSQLLDFRKIESSGLRLNFVSTNINELLSERYRSFKVLADQQNIQLTIALPDVPVMAEVDNDAIQKILNNLLYNALHYCDRRVHIELAAATEQAAHFAVSISNDGRVIPSELGEKIFQPFFRLKEDAGKAGSGIGLALSRSLASLHRGRLVLEEPVNGMNVFRLILPLKQAAVLR